MRELIKVSKPKKRHGPHWQNTFLEQKDTPNTSKMTCMRFYWAQEAHPAQFWHATCIRVTFKTCQNHATTHLFCMLITRREKSCVTFSDGIKDADGTYFGAQEVSMGMSCNRRNKSCKRSMLHDLCVSSKSCGDL